MTGLKPVDGGSIPSFLGLHGLGLEQRRVPRMCGKGEGIREVIQRWLWLFLLLRLLVWQQRLLRG